MRSLHYARLFFSGVVDIINGPRHQLIINKAQTPLGPRPSNFCIVTIIYSSSPPLLFSPRFWEPRDPPQPGFFLEARDNPGKEVGGVIEFSDALLTATLGWFSTSYGYFHYVKQQNRNVSWRRRAQIKQLAWPMAERQIGQRKSRLVLSARFPVVNWRSRPVAKSAYWWWGPLTKTLR